MREGGFLIHGAVWLPFGDSDSSLICGATTFLPPTSDISEFVRTDY